VNSLPNPTASPLRFKPGPSAPESSTLTTRLPSHPWLIIGLFVFASICDIIIPVYYLAIERTVVVTT